jgi:uncharacterized protein YjiS (DUF1127 family)
LIYNSELLICKNCNTRFAALHYIDVVKATQVKSIQRGMTMFDFVKTKYSRWQCYSRTVSELNGLSGRELADLGIARTDINRLAREATR